MRWSVTSSEDRGLETKPHAVVPVWAILGGLLASADVAAAIAALVAPG